MSVHKLFSNKVYMKSGLEYVSFLVFSYALDKEYFSPLGFLQNHAFKIGFRNNVRTNLILSETR